MLFDPLEHRIVLRERDVAQLEPCRVDIAPGCTDDHEGQAEEAIERLARWWVEAPVERNPYGKAALGRNVASQLGQERIGAEVFENRETLPCG